MRPIKNSRGSSRFCIHFLNVKGEHCNQVPSRSVVGYVVSCLGRGQRIRHTVLPHAVRRTGQGRSGFSPGYTSTKPRRVNQPGGCVFHSLALHTHRLLVLHRIIHYHVAHKVQFLQSTARVAKNNNRFQTTSGTAFAQMIRGPRYFVASQFTCRHEYEGWTS